MQRSNFVEEKTNKTIQNGVIDTQSKDLVIKENVDTVDTKNNKLEQTETFLMNEKDEEVCQTANSPKDTDMLPFVLKLNLPEKAVICSNVVAQQKLPDTTNLLASEINQNTVKLNLITEVIKEGVSSNEVDDNIPSLPVSAEILPISPHTVKTVTEPIQAVVKPVPQINLASEKDYPLLQSKSSNRKIVEKGQKGNYKIIFCCILLCNKQTNFSRSTKQKEKNQICSVRCSDKL